MKKILVSLIAIIAGSIGIAQLDTGDTSPSPSTQVTPAVVESVVPVPSETKATLETPSAPIVETEKVPAVVPPSKETVVGNTGKTQSTTSKVLGDETQKTSASGKGYTNVDGLHIPSPSSDPQGASARCRDGTYSYSTHRQGTCSHHGGVSQWL